MKTIDILMDEHRVIERVLDVLEKGATRLQAGDAVSPDFFVGAADFIRGFADGCHHRKEEGVLFEVMVERGMPKEGGPIGVMLSEHEEARRLTRGMREGAEQMAAGDSDAARRVAGFALDYVALLRQHIQKEDNVLFPMAGQFIAPADEAAVLERYETVEREESGEGAHEEYVALAEKLRRMIEDS